MKDATGHAQRKRVDNLERALREERTGLVAIAAACLQECPDPARLMNRLEGMAHAAGAARKPGRQYDAIIAGREIFARAFEQHIMKPQGLFDPDVGHVDPGTVEKLVADAPVQMALQSPKVQREDLLAARRLLQERIVELLRAGPRTDREIWTALGQPRLTFDDCYYLRSELTKRGRVVRSETNALGPIWTLPEIQKAVTSERTT